MNLKQLKGTKLRKSLNAKWVRMGYHNKQKAGTGSLGIVIGGDCFGR